MAGENGDCSSGSLKRRFNVHSITVVHDGMGYCEVFIVSTVMVIILNEEGVNFGISKQNNSPEKRLYNEMKKKKISQTNAFKII